MQSPILRKHRSTFVSEIIQDEEHDSESHKISTDEENEEADNEKLALNKKSPLIDYSRKQVGNLQSLLISKKFDT